MAIVLRSGLGRLAPSHALLSKAVAKQLPCLQQAASISSKTYRELNGIKRPPPYDYVRKPYNYIRSRFEKTSHRFDDNTKVIVVDGPIASGKTKFAQDLAKELDMRYIEHANMDHFLINEYGFDFRSLNPKLPKSAWFMDEAQFLADPSGRLTGILQMHLYHLRYFIYIDALAHVLSTGEGVVMDRSVYSDIVFVETLYRTNLISKNVHKALHEVRDNTLIELLKPHLVIYLDVPVDVVQQRIKERNQWGEANSPLFKDNKFLSTMEDMHKHEYLQDISSHAEILVYDWTNGGDVELVVEDIERIDFDRFEKEDSKMKDWRVQPTEDAWCEMRMNYTQEAPRLRFLTNVPVYYAPELLLDPELEKIRDDLILEAPGEEYAYGYNTDLGDTNVLLKSKQVIAPRRKLY